MGHFHEVFNPLAGWLGFVYIMVVGIQENEKLQASWVLFLKLEFLWHLIEQNKTQSQSRRKGQGNDSASSVRGIANSSCRGRG